MTDLVLRSDGRIRDIPRDAWDALAGDDASPFVEWTWLDCLEEAGCVGPGTGWTPCHLTLWEGDTLVAGAPAYVKTNSEGEFIFDWAWADERPASRAIVRSAWAKIAVIAARSRPAATRSRCPVTGVNGTPTTSFG